MIRKFVPLNKTVTDFCCVLNFMDMGGSKKSFEILSGHSYSSLQIQNSANDDSVTWFSLIISRHAHSSSAIFVNLVLAHMKQASGSYYGAFYNRWSNQWLSLTSAFH